MGATNSSSTANIVVSTMPRLSALVELPVIKDEVLAGHFPSHRYLCHLWHDLCQHFHSFRHSLVVLERVHAVEMHGHFVVPLALAHPARDFGESGDIAPEIVVCLLNDGVHFGCIRLT